MSLCSYSFPSVNMFLFLVFIILKGIKRSIPCARFNLGTRVSGQVLSLRVCARSPRHREGRRPREEGSVQPRARRAPRGFVSNNIPQGLPETGSY